MVSGGGLRTAIVATVAGAVVLVSGLVYVVKSSMKAMMQPIYVLVPAEPNSLEIPEKTLETLIVNNSNSYRAVVNMNEREGINRLKELTNTEVFEASWLYVPELEQWNQIGRIRGKEVQTDKETGKFHYANTLTIDPLLMYHFFENHDNLTYYDMHPLDLPRMEKLMAGSEFEGNPEPCARFIEVQKTGFAIPSYRDLLFMVHFHNEFYKRNPDGEINFRVASPLGITEYGLTEEGKKRFAGIFGGESIAEAMGDREIIWKAGLPDPRYDAVKKVHEIFNEMEDREIYMRFSSYSEILN